MKGVKERCTFLANDSEFLSAYLLNTIITIIKNEQKGLVVSHIFNNKIDLDFLFSTIRNESNFITTIKSQKRR